MGSFFGHALPGTFFIMAGFWWVVRIYQRYYQSLRKNGTPYMNSVTFPIHTRASRCRSQRCTPLDIEAIVVVIMCGLGILVEIVIAPIFRHTYHIGMNNAQHGTMYFFFGLVGVVALISTAARFLPQNDDILYLTLALAYVTEAVLFQFHLFGRENIDILLHTLLLYTVYGAIVSVIAEMACRHNMLLAQCRAFFTILQGTWFWQAGFYLYNPFRGEAWAGQYDSHDGDPHMTHKQEHKMHETMMFMTCSFAWHMGAIFIIILIIGAVIGCRNRRRGDLDEMKMLPRKYPAMAGYSRVGEDDDDDEDEQIWGRDVVNRNSEQPTASNHLHAVERHDENSTKTSE